MFSKFADLLKIFLLHLRLIKGDAQSSLKAAFGFWFSYRFSEILKKKLFLKLNAYRNLWITVMSSSELEAVTRGFLCKKVFFLCKKVPKACNFIKKETLAQVFSCEFCEISKKTLFTEHLDDCF